MTRLVKVIATSIKAETMKSMKTKRNKNYLSIILLLTGMLLSIKATAIAQTQIPSAPVPISPSPTRIPITYLPNLRVTAGVQGNCAPLTFQVANTGGSSSEAFKITVTNKAGKVLQTFSVTKMEAGETLNFKYPPTDTKFINLDADGPYTVVVDPDNAINELSKKDNTIKIETRCIR